MNRQQPDASGPVSLRVGWIGLGAMGFPMAQCLVGAGHDVAAFDLDPVRRAQFTGVQAVSAVQAVERAEVVAIMVATPAQLEEVLFGTDGISGALLEGAIILIMATVGPDAMMSTAQRLGVRVQVVDSPVSGGVARASAGDLLFMVSGSGDAVERVQPLIDVMARESAFFGEDIGSAQKAKLVNQLLCGVHIAVAAEALAFAEALGLDTDQIWATLRTGAGASFMFDDRGARMLLGDFDEVKSALGIFVKDMQLVTAAGSAHGLRTEIASAALAAFLDGQDAGLARQDDSSVIEVMRARKTP
jgi:3-hydroxyisobutyrate dehydrogenase